MCGVGLQEPEHEVTGSAPLGECFFLIFHSKPVLCCSGQLRVGCGTGPGVPAQARYPALTPHPLSTGPIEQLPDYNRIRSGMYWLRF